MLLRLAEIGAVAALPQKLLRYRLHGGMISSNKIYEQQICNVCALSSAILRTRGESDPLALRRAGLDYPAMSELADAAGLPAWLRWRQYRCYYDAKAEEELLDALRGLSITPLPPDARERLAEKARYLCVCNPDWAAVLAALVCKAIADHDNAPILRRAKAMLRNIKAMLSVKKQA